MMCKINLLSPFSWRSLLACIDYRVTVSGIVGEVDKEAKSFYMWTHKRLDIGYNQDQDAIVDVNLTSEAKVTLEPGARISFTYEVPVKLFSHIIAAVI